MIARIWRGAVAQTDGDACAEYMDDTGVTGYTGTPGNRGVSMLRRDVEDNTLEVAVFHPPADPFLVESDEFVSHYEVARHVQP